MAAVKRVSVGEGVGDHNDLQSASRRGAGVSDPGAPARRLTLPIVLIVSLFFLWGMANNLNDPLIKHFKKLFTLSDFGSGLVQSAFYLGYFLFAIPAALFMQRFSYKAAVILGLVLYGAGALLFYPAGEMQSYGFFLAALFVIASGLAFLETSANPMVATWVPGNSERRLNFAQSFNPLDRSPACSSAAHSSSRESNIRRSNCRR